MNYTTDNDRNEMFADLLLHPHVFQHGSEPAYNQNDFYNKKLNYASSF